MIANPAYTFKIGKHCSIAPGVTALVGMDHNPKNVSTSSTIMKLTGTLNTGGNVEIGNDVWLGFNTILVGECKLGDGVIVGAGSVVKGTIPPYSIVAGSPAKHVRFRFPLSQIERLLELRWWDWEETKLVNFAPFLMSENVEAFLRIAGMGQK